MKKMWKLLASSLLVIGLASCGEEPEPLPEPDVEVTGVTVNESSLTVALGDTVTLTATVSPADATNKNVKWESSNEDIATVSQTGVVTTNTVGNVAIRCWSENEWFYDTTYISVKELDEILKLDLTGLDEDELESGINLRIEEVRQLNCRVLSSEEDFDKTVTWETDDDGVVTVTDEGLLEAVAPGNATITVTSDDLEDIYIDIDVNVIDGWTMSEVEFMNSVNEADFSVPYIQNTETEIYKLTNSNDGSNILGVFYLPGEGCEYTLAQLPTVLLSTFAEENLDTIPHNLRTAYEFHKYSDNGLDYAWADIYTAPTSVAGLPQAAVLLLGGYSDTGVTSTFDYETMSLLAGYDFPDLTANEGSKFFYNMDAYEAMYDFGEEYHDQLWEVEADCGGYSIEIISIDTEDPFYDSGEFGYYDSNMMITLDSMINSSYFTGYYLRNKISFVDAFSINVIIQKIYNAGYELYTDMGGLAVFYKTIGDYVSFIETISVLNMGTDQLGNRYYTFNLWSSINPANSILFA